MIDALKVLEGNNYVYFFNSYRGEKQAFKLQQFSEWFMNIFHRISDNNVDILHIVGVLMDDIIKIKRGDTMICVAPFSLQNTAC